MKKIDELCGEYIQREKEKKEYPEYKASGMAYIKFAKEEKELFKLLYMRDRTGEHYPEKDDLTNEMERHVHQNTGLDGAEKELFHLEMWAFVHGIATMFATNFLELEWSLVSQIVTDAYQGLKKRYEKAE